MPLAAVLSPEVGSRSVATAMRFHELIAAMAITRFPSSAFENCSLASSHTSSGTPSLRFEIIVSASVSASAARSRAVKKGA